MELMNIEKAKIDLKNIVEIHIFNLEIKDKLIKLIYRDEKNIAIRGIVDIINKNIEIPLSDIEKEKLKDIMFNFG